ncbi:MAG: FHA domain-containing protein [bacterium]
MSSFRLDLELNGNVQSFTFSSPSVTIGRDPASDVFLDHATVSRQHALIVQNPHGFTLVVLSQNGLTGVNGNKVNGSVDLQNGMRLQFGQFLANFQTDSGHATMPFEPIRGGGPLLTDHPTQPNAQFGAGPVVVGNAPTGVLQNAPTAAIPAIGGAMGGFGAPLQPSQGGFAPGPALRTQPHRSSRLLAHKP